MNDERLGTLLGTIIVPAIIKNTFRVREEDNFEAFVTKFYSSKFYSLLSDSRTALWHLSPLLLSEMYLEEIDIGDITMPEEQS